MRQTTFFDGVAGRMLDSVAVDAFRVEYEDLCAASPGWGTISLLPWDEEIFGFPVANLELGAEPPRTQDLTGFADALAEFSTKTKAQLISTHAPGDDLSAMAWLVKAGFSPVEFSLTATLTRLQSAKLPSSPLPLRKAVPEDLESLCAIAGTAFQFGRYHTDPRFPRELANARYVHWIRSAVESANADDHVFVLEQRGAVAGFMDVVISEGRADLRLGAVDPSISAGFPGAGLSLYFGSVQAAKELGAKSISTKFAAANTRVLNVFSAMGFRFSKPEVVLHWHSAK